MAFACSRWEYITGRGKNQVVTAVAGKQQEKTDPLNCGGKTTGRGQVNGPSDAITPAIISGIAILG